MMSRTAVTYYIEEKLRLMTDDKFFDTVSNIFKCDEDMLAGAIICPFADKCIVNDEWKSCKDIIEKETKV